MTVGVSLFFSAKAMAQQNVFYDMFVRETYKSFMENDMLTEEQKKLVTFDVFNDYFKKCGESEKDVKQASFCIVKNMLEYTKAEKGNNEVKAAEDIDRLVTAMGMAKEGANTTPKDEPVPEKEVLTAQEIFDKAVADENLYSLGNPKGSVIIIEFFDYNCGYCKLMNKRMREIISSPKNKHIRWIPLDTPIFGEMSAVVSRAVLAAGKQGKYAQMKEAVEKLSSPNKATLIKEAQKIGLDTEKLEEDMKSEEIAIILRNNQKWLANISGGVPTSIINGKQYRGAISKEQLEKLLKSPN